MELERIFQMGRSRNISKEEKKKHHDCFIKPQGIFIIYLPKPMHKISKCMCLYTHSFEVKPHEFAMLFTRTTWVTFFRRVSHRNPSDSQNNTDFKCNPWLPLGDGE